MIGIKSERFKRIKEEVKSIVLNRLDLTQETDDSVIEDMIEEEIIKKSRTNRLIWQKNWCFGRRFLIP